MPFLRLVTIPNAALRFRISLDSLLILEQIVNIRILWIDTLEENDFEHDRPCFQPCSGGASRIGSVP